MNYSVTVRNKIYFYIACAISMLVFLPARLSFGIVVLVEFNFLMFAGIGICYLIKLAKLEELKSVLFPAGLVFLTILFKQLLILFNPIMALTLGFAIYIPALSSALFEICFKDELVDFKHDLKFGMLKAFKFSVVAIIVFTLRDILGYGTLTLPMFRGVFIIHMPFNLMRISAGSFLATIPGGFVCVSVIALITIIFNEKFMKAEEEKEND